MTFDELFPGKYLKKEDVPHPITTTILRIGRETVKTQDGMGEEQATMIYLSGLKPMFLKPVNGAILKSLFGTNPDTWIGKTVELYVDPTVTMKGKIVGGVRFRQPIYQNQNGHGHHANPVVLSWPDAQKRAAEAGISHADLVAKLKARGNPGYNPERDTSAVLEIIGQAKQGKEESFGDSYEGPAGGEEVPLA